MSTVEEAPAEIYDTGTVEQALTLAGITTTTLKLSLAGTTAATDRRCWAVLCCAELCSYAELCCAVPDLIEQKRRKLLKQPVEQVQQVALVQLWCSGVLV